MNRRERSNHFKSNDCSRTVDNHKKEPEQRLDKSKNDGFRLGQKYRLRRERKLVLGIFVMVLVYISLMNLSIGHMEREVNTEGSQMAIGTLGGEQSKTDERFQVTKLRPIDTEQYTIRMNTWRRNKQLVQSVKHHASCPGVKEIQVVWCDKENEPPAELLEMAERKSPTSSSSSETRVVIERHEANSLNERFNVIEPTPTLGILSIDDDVLRPCDAIDSAFFKWVRSPHRMVGFDARTHVENDDGSWQYGYLSTTKKENMYSLSLTRYCFIHRDYMTRYIRDLPSTILDTVATKFNCEDIAMSLMISSLTQGQPPLLADLWVMNSQIQMEVDSGISGSSNHKKFRDGCLNTFSEMLGLKDSDGERRLQKAQWVHRTNTWFDCGANEDDNTNNAYEKSKREIELERKWKVIRGSEGKELLKKYLLQILYETGEDARANGLLSSKKKFVNWQACKLLDGCNVTRPHT